MLDQQEKETKYTFVYCNPEGETQRFTSTDKEEAKDSAQYAYFEDMKSGVWNGIDTAGCIWEEDTIDNPEEGNTHALTSDSSTPSIANGDTWADSEVSISVSDYDKFMDDVCSDDEPVNDDTLVDMQYDYEKTNDVLEAATEAMNPVEPTPTFKGGWGSNADGTSKHSDKRTVDTGVVSSVAVERQGNHDKWLSDLGIARPEKNISITKAGYQRGKAVVDLGYDNLDAARTVWDGKPTVSVAANTFIDIINAEEREDITIDMDRITMRDDGQLKTEHGVLALEEEGLKKLLSMSRFGLGEENDVAGNPLFPYAHHTFMLMDPDIRAYAFNNHMSRYGVSGRSIKLRTRKNGGGRSVFGIVGPKYVSYDANLVANIINEATKNVPYRADIQYNSKTTNFTMDLTMHAPSDLVDFSAGDCYEVGYRFKSNDRGGGAINGSAIAFWNECLNMIILHSEKSEGIRVVHKGNVAEKVKLISESLKNGESAMMRFANDWNILGNTAIENYIVPDDTLGDISPAAMFITQQVAAGTIGNGIGRDAMVQMILNSYDDQGRGDTAQDVINAITRSAHQHLVDDCARDTLEREAGALVRVLANTQSAPEMYV